MKKANFSLILIAIVLVVFSCKKKKDDITPPTTTVVDTTMVFYGADHALLQFNGRIDFSNPKAPLFSYPGVSMVAKFEGTSVDLVLKDFGVGGATTTNYFAVIIDGAMYTSLKVNATDTIYPISRTLSDGPHTIEFFKRTESSVGRSSFRGIQILKNKSLLALPAKSSRKIEFIGDSFTCGYGNEVSIPAPPAGNPSTGFHSVNENNYSAWGAITCRSLSAQYMCTAYSGRGLYRNNSGLMTGTLPILFNQIHGDLTTPTWTHSNYVPDVTVITLGTNDLAPEAWGTPSMLDSASFVNAYISFVQSIRSKYPNTEIICVVSSSISDDYPAGFKWKTRMSNYIQAVDNYFASDSKVHRLTLPSKSAPYGEDYHQSNVDHQKMANTIVPFIQSITGW